MAKEESEPNEAGAGGKLKKRPWRKPATPYDRTGTSRRGWISNLPNPARLIADSANKLLLSSIRKRLLPFTETDPEVMQESGSEVPNDISKTLLKETKEQEVSSKGDHPKGGSDTLELAGDRPGNGSDGNGLLQVEQLLKQKTFSRDEFDRLTALLRSRTVDHSEDDIQARRKLNMVAVETPAHTWQKDLRITPEGNQENPRENRATGRISTSFFPSAMRDEGASPVDIAKAYMGTQTSITSRGSQCLKSKDERNTSCTDAFASKSPISSIAPKSSICWPGAMGREDCGYLTPQTSRGRVVLHDWSKTPYPKAVHTSSKVAGESPTSVSSSLWRQPHTPVFGGSQALKRNSSVLDDGSIRRIRQKSNLMTSRGAGSSRLSTPVPWPSASSDVYKRFLPTKENLGFDAPKSSALQVGERKEKSFGVGPTSVPPHSSEMARKILEHLDKVVPSAKEKSEELKLAIAKDKSSPNLARDLVDDRDIFNVQVSGDRGKSSGQIQSESIKANKARGTNSSMIGTRYSVDLKKNGFQTSTHEVFMRPDHGKDGGKNQSSSHYLNKQDTSTAVEDTSNALCSPSRTPQPKDGSSVPSFGFGSTNGSMGAVFSFISTSCIDASTPEFSFGSGKKAKVSFSLAVAAAAAQTTPGLSKSGTESGEQGQAGTSGWAAPQPAKSISSFWAFSNMTSPGGTSSTSAVSTISTISGLGITNPSKFSTTFNFSSSSSPSFSHTAASSSSLASTPTGNLFGANPFKFGAGSSSVTSNQTIFHSSSGGSLIESSTTAKFGTGASFAQSTSTNAYSNQSNQTKMNEPPSGSSNRSPFTATFSSTHLGSSSSASPFSFGLASKSSSAISPLFGASNKRSLDASISASLGDPSTSSGPAASRALSGTSPVSTFSFAAPTVQSGPLKLASIFSSKVLGPTSNQASMELMSSVNAPTTPASADMGIGFPAIFSGEKSTPRFGAQPPPVSHEFSTGSASSTGGNKSGRRCIKINRDKRKR